MAEGDSQMLAKVKEGVTCSICLDTYTEPKQLQCNHIFCQKCLAKLVKISSSIVCPLCKEDTFLSGKGVAGLQSAFQIMPFLSIVEEDQNSGMTLPRAKRRKLDSKEPSYCSTHKEREIELFCEKCSKLICYKCVVNGDHAGHEHKEMDKALEYYLEQVKSSVVPVKEQLGKVGSLMTGLEKCRKEITDQQKVISATIDEATRQLHASIDAKKVELTQQLNEVTKGKLSKIDLKMNQMKSAQDLFSGCLDSMNKILSMEECDDVEQMKAAVDRVGEARKRLRLHELKPAVEADVLFSFSSDICKVHGQLLHCNVSGKGLSESQVGKKSVVNLRVTNMDGIVCKEVTCESLKCEFVSVSPMRGLQIKDPVQCFGNSWNFGISYTPSSVGLHLLSVKVKGQHVGGSPFEVTVHGRSSDHAVQQPAPSPIHQTTPTLSLATNRHI